MYVCINIYIYTAVELFGEDQNGQNAQQWDTMYLLMKYLKTSHRLLCLKLQCVINLMMTHSRKVFSD